MRRLALVLILPLWITGCSLLGQVDTRVEPQTPRQTLIVLEYSVQGVASSAKELAVNGIIKPGSPEANRAADLIVAAQAALHTARNVERTGGDLNAATSAVNAAVLQAINYLEARKKPNG
jgi:hypothetical protein